MKIAKDLILSKNKNFLERYETALNSVKEIQKDIKNNNDKKAQYSKALVEKILDSADFLEEFNEDWYKSKNIEELKEINANIYKEVLPENYDKSFANPAYCVEVFGKEIGPALASFYSTMRGLRGFAKDYKKYKIAVLAETFIDVYEFLKNDSKELENLKKILNKPVYDMDMEEVEIGIKETFDPKSTKDIENLILNADLDDLRYLYQYNEFITENEFKTAEFLKNYPEENIDTLVKNMVKAFIRGFELDNKDISTKENVLLMYNIGDEKIIKKLIPELKANNIYPVFSRINSSDFNEQYVYDHKFDNALYLTEEFVELNLKLYEEAAEKNKSVMKKFAGPFAFTNFGKEPFSPADKDENLKLSAEQKKLSQKMAMSRQQINQKYIPRHETSFTAIAFPTPEIGEKFEEIYAKTFEINMLDSFKYEEIQKNIIDELDKADYVHIKGKDDNRTDLKVKLQKLENPEKETNFVNCGATVNIPVGEVFTSPQLKKTTGVLHVTDTFLRSLNYKDLELVFEDGFVKEYSCANFDKEEKNKEYIENNLLFPHKTLPMGEFAIGTNTIAYVMAQKYEIGKLLPILIGEKMGPHFAIGDTCFSWGEDTKTYNPIDNKEIKSKDNEKTLARKEGKFQDAYTNCHTDITVPYEELDSITAVTKTGKEIPIIKDGKFVVPGTEELNLPLKELGI